MAKALPVLPEHLAAFEELLKSMVEECHRKYQSTETLTVVYSFGTKTDQYYVMSDGTYRRGEPFNRLPAQELPTVSLEEIAPDKKVLI